MSSNGGGARDAPETTKPARRGRKLALRAAGALVATPVLLVGFLHTPPGEAVLRARVEEVLGERVSTKATVGNLTFSLAKGVRIEKVIIVGNDQKDAITIDSIFVDLSLKKTFGGAPTLETLGVKGVSVDLRGNADGTTNLTGVFVQKKPVKHLVIEQVDVSGVRVALTKPDGTKLEVTGVGLAGHADVKPDEKTFDVELALDAEAIRYEKPGTKVAVERLSTKAQVRLVGGDGPVTLGPTKANLLVGREGQPPFPLALALPPVKLGLKPGELTLATEALQLAAISMAVAKLEVRRTPEGELSGRQLGDIAKLTIVADEANVLAGKKILASDVAIDAHLEGPPEKLALGLTVTTAGGALEAKGTLDATNRSLGLTLTSKSLDLKRIVALDAVPEVTVGGLQVTGTAQRDASGQPDATFTVHLDKSVVKQVPIERLDAKGRYQAGVVTVDSLELHAAGQELRGDLRFTPETKTLAANLSTRGSVGQTLRILHDVGIAGPPSPLMSSVSIVRPLKLRVDGALNRGLVVHIDDATLAAVGGTVHAEGRVDLVAGDPAKGEKRFRAETVDTTLTLAGVSLDTLGKLRGKPLPVSGTVSGKVHVTGSAQAPDADFQVAAALHGHAGGAGSLSIAGTSRAGALDANVTLVGRGGEKLLETKARGYLANKTLSPDAPLDVRVDIPKRPLSDFAPLLSAEVAKKLPSASAEVHAKISGTLSRPVADVRVEADGALVPSFASKTAPTTQRAVVVLHTEPSKKGATVTARADLTVAEGFAPIVVQASAELAGPLTAARTAGVDWTVDVTVPETDLASLPLPPEKREGLSGKAGVVVHAKGNRRDVTADVTAGLVGFSRGPLRALDAKLEAHVDPSHTTATLATTLHGEPLVTGRAEVALPGKDLLTLAGRKELGDPAVDVKLEIAKTRLTTLSPFAPDGTVFGMVAVQGHVKNPTFTAHLEGEGLRTLSGKPAPIELDAKGTLDELGASVGIGHTVTVAAKASPRAYLEAKRGEGLVPLSFAIRSAPQKLVDVLPHVAAVVPWEVDGQLTSDLTANLLLHVKGEARKLEKLTVEGALVVDHTHFHVPGSSRTFEGVKLVLRGQGDGLAIEKLELHEHDREKADRVLSAHGRFAIPTRTAELYVDARDVLVFGGNFGRPDAPRAALTGKLAVHADLASTVKRVDVTVDTLELSSPDRFPRAHAQEALSLGDVIELGAGTAIGKLVRQSADEANPKADAGPPEKTLEVHVAIPNTIHVKQKPLDLFAKGEVVFVRTTAGRTLSGKLVCEKGSLVVGGVAHGLDHGEVLMTNDGPFLNLHFKREPHPAAMRDFATLDNGLLYAHMTGPFGRQKISFSGAADGLFEALALNNGGRVRVLSSPEAPASQTAQLPQTREIRLTAYMAANLPHLAFLNRMSTQAEPNQGKTYGRFQSLEAERYSLDGTRRLRATSRSPVIGQSDGEVELDYLFSNTPQVVSGVGLLGGTRAGGGPSVFWEWSSKD
ncbi:MAG TPA: hypothetical protein PK141_07210 [Polyangiaceae bacterium]|nr:hypothetical protein [Polyangiaceae bacterium]